MGYICRLGHVIAQGGPTHSAFSVPQRRHCAFSGLVVRSVCPSPGGPGRSQGMQCRACADAMVFRGWSQDTRCRTCVRPVVAMSCSVVPLPPNSWACVSVCVCVGGGYCACWGELWDQCSIRFSVIIRVISNHQAFLSARPYVPIKKRGIFWIILVLFQQKTALCGLFIAFHACDFHVQCLPQIFLFGV